MLHGSPRNTVDLDVCVSTEHENLERLGKLLGNVDARLRGLNHVMAVNELQAIKRLRG